jgi:hypothetical protein
MCSQSIFYGETIIGTVQQNSVSSTSKLDRPNVAVDSNHNPSSLDNLVDEKLKLRIALAL